MSGLLVFTTLNALNLHAGATFELYKVNIPGYVVRFVVIAQVQQLPAVDSTSGGGIVVDYQSFAPISAGAGIYHIPLSVNHIWLQTSNDPAALTSVRSALNSSPLHLDNLSDRRALSDTLSSDPLSLNLVGLLAIGATAALLLALAGNLLISWLSVRRRLADFTVLRALGAAPKQIADVLIWEQSIIYAATLFLGVSFGALLVVTTVPSLVFTSPPGEVTSAVNSTQLYALQHIVPLRIVVPPA